VSVPGFTGANHLAWVSHEAGRTFLIELHALDARRAGKALLRTSSPADLDLCVEVYDSPGHVRIVGHVGDDLAWTNGVQTARIPHRIEIDPGMLPHIVARCCRAPGQRTLLPLAVSVIRVLPPPLVPI
jgi:hypothetical protein